MAYKCLKQLVCNIQVVNDAAECKVQDVQEYTHMNSGPGDWAMLYSTDICGHVAQLHDNLNAI